LPGGSGEGLGLPRMIPTSIREFYESAMEILCPRMNGFIFEQEYHPKIDRFPPAKSAKDLDDFFCKVPKDSRYHI
jgi:hypothetical protein